MGKCRFLFFGILLFSAWAFADVATQDVDYEVDGQSFTGYLAYDDAVRGERPGILLVHEWWGHTDYVRERAEMLAKWGYTAFALDMYGSGKQAGHPEQAQAFMEAVMSDVEAAERRFEAAQRLLQEHKTVAPGQIAALGYCFGGGVVLHMARQGADLEAVISYHGLLATENPAQAGDVRADIRVFTGGSDPMVPKQQVVDFKEEMRAAGADFKVYSYPDAQHGFTNPEADELGERFDMPLAYDAQADADSWSKTLEFLERQFD